MTLCRCSFWVMPKISRGYSRSPLRRCWIIHFESIITGYIIRLCGVQGNVVPRQSPSLHLWNNYARWCTPRKIGSFICSTHESNLTITIVHNKRLRPYLFCVIPKISCRYSRSGRYCHFKSIFISEIKWICVGKSHISPRRQYSLLNLHNCIKEVTIILIRSLGISTDIKNLTKITLIWNQAPCRNLFWVEPKIWLRTYFVSVFCINIKWIRSRERDINPISRSTAIDWIVDTCKITWLDSCPWFSWYMRKITTTEITACIGYWTHCYIVYWTVEKTWQGIFANSDISRCICYNWNSWWRYR